MKNVTLATIGCLLSSAASAKDVNESLDADAEGQVIVTNLAGSVSVEGWSKKTVELTGSIGDDVDELVFERDGDEIVIKVRTPERSKGRSDITSELTIRVPSGSSLEVATVSADIDVADVLGVQDLQTVSGDIVTEAFASDANADTVSGDIELQGNGEDTDIDLVSVSGDITAEGLAGSVSAESVSGDVVVADGSFDRVQLETVQGDIEFNAALQEDGKLHVDTVNGDVDIELPGDVSARFDIDTFNGDIDNCFGPEAERTSHHAPGLELRFTEGDGNGRVSISAFNGDVAICK